MRKNIRTIKRIQTNSMIHSMIFKMISSAKQVRYNVLDINERRLGIRWQFIPEVREVRYYPDGSGQPGEPAEIDVRLIVDLSNCIPIDVSDDEYNLIEKELFSIIDKEQEEYWRKEAEYYEQMKKEAN